MAKDYSWYEKVEDASLEQGDLFQNCPVIEAVSDLAYPQIGKDISVDIRRFDAVVLTQSCDFEQKSVNSVILCPHWDLAEIGQMHPKLSKRETQANVMNGRMPRYSMLEASDIAGLEMGIRIVDMERVFRLPIAFVQQMATPQTPRLRLCSPYKEHLSQAFARFFMRVGLPQNIKLP